MEHHWEFNVYSKHARAEILVDTLFFKHKYLTSPIVTPEDTVTEATKRLTDAVTSNSKITESEQMESLQKLASFKRNFQRKIHNKCQTINQKTIA